MVTPTRCKSNRVRLSATPLLAISLTVLPLTGQGIAQDHTAHESRSANEKTDADGGAASLQFSFDRTPWRDVIKWLADESQLALQFEDLPTGSFSYSDPHTFTHEQALDRINLFLIPQGYTLVRSGRLLSVINLGDPRSMQQLDALADLIPASELAARSEHDVVKCLFPLGELQAQEATEELSVLNLMTPPVVFNKTNQIMITDTVAKLRNVKAILDAFVPKGLGNGTVMKTFPLKHVTAEDVLLVARPHLGLATGEMIGIDVSLSADLRGEYIFVTGAEDRVKLIEGLVQALDQPTQDISASDGQVELRAHLVEGGNVEMVYNVLQTLLAGKSLRLSMDETASSIVALASTDVQREIEQTVAQLQATEADFEVITLKSVDPYFAISLLEEMLDLPDSFADPEDIPPGTPKIDADPGNMRLFVRAKRHQIEQIKKIVAGLDSGSPTQQDDLRILPLHGQQAIQTLETAAKFWRGDNPVILFTAPEEVQPAQTERIVGVGQGGGTRMVTVSDRKPPGARYLTDNIHSQEPMIRCQLISRGLLLQSEDIDSLDAFEQHLRTITGPGDSIPSPPIVFYLQYTKPEDALRMLAELLDGGESAKEAEAGTLVNGYVGSSDSYLGSIVTSRDGTMTMLAGSITVVADSRLNRLIAQGSGSDIHRIESYLEIIDKDSSIASIQTYGTSRIIELRYTQASEVAATLRDAFAGRVAANSSAAGGTSTRGATPGKPEPPEPRGEDNASDKDRNDKKAPAKSSQPPRNLEPTMTIAIHEPSNSLIITAPDQLFSEVEQLVQRIDTRSEQTVEILAPSNAAVLQSILQPGSNRSGRDTGTSSSNGSRNDSSRDARSAVFELLKSRGGR